MSEKKPHLNYSDLHEGMIIRSPHSGELGRIDWLDIPSRLVRIRWRGMNFKPVYGDPIERGIIDSPLSCASCNGRGWVLPHISANYSVSCPVCKGSTLALDQKSPDPEAGDGALAPSGAPC